MADGNRKSGRQEHRTVTLKTDYDVRYWTERFGVSKETLQAAMRNVGDSVAALEGIFMRRKAS